MKEYVAQGRTVEEAIDEACRQLGVLREDADFEIIDLPKRGFLGFRNTPAKVRVFVESAEEPVVKQEQKPAQKPPRQQEAAKKPQEKKPAKQSAPKQEKPAPKQESAQPEVQLDFVSLEKLEDGKAKVAAEYVRDVLLKMDLSVGIEVASTENGIVIRLVGDSLGVTIGRRGETLDSLQYLAGLVANREEGDYMRVTIDSGNYRAKRERTLQQLAKKLSASAIRYGRPSTLEPMNPYERRIIHSTVSAIDGVSSSSVGEEPNRRVVITPDNLKPQRGGNNNRRSSGGGRPPQRGGRGGQGGGGPRRDRGPRQGGGNGGGGQRPSSAPARDIDREYAKELEREAPAFVKPQQDSGPPKREIAAAPKKELKEAEDLPLYGKIEL